MSRHIRQAITNTPQGELRSKSMVRNSVKQVVKSRLSGNYHPPGASAGVGMTRILEKRYLMQQQTQQPSPRGLGISDNIA